MWSVEMRSVENAECRKCGVENACIKHYDLLGKSILY